MSRVGKIMSLRGRSRESSIKLNLTPIQGLIVTENFALYFVRLFGEGVFFQ